MKKNKVIIVTCLSHRTKRHKSGLKFLLNIPSHIAIASP